MTVLLGTALMGSFATLLETSGGAGISDADAEALGTMALVVGGWGTLIVLFSVASTLGITVRQRVAEIGLLRDRSAPLRGRPAACCPARSSRSSTVGRRPRCAARARSAAAPCSPC